MSEQPDSFWKELKNRKVVRVGVLYAVVGWAVLQVADTVTGILELPTWAAQFILVVVTLGFPVALVLAWRFRLPQTVFEGRRPSPLRERTHRGRHSLAGWRSGSRVWLRSPICSPETRTWWRSQTSMKDSWQLFRSSSAARRNSAT